MSVVLTDRPAPSVARLLINRPHKRNAIDHDVREQLFQSLLEIKADTTIRALVIGGVEGVFSAGGDLDSMGGLTEAQARERMQHIHRLCREFANFPLPVVAAVEGFCAGAAVGMSLLSDYIIVGKQSKIIFPFMGLGLVPDWGAVFTLPRRVGLPRARQLMTAGKVSGGEYCYEIGLADEYVGEDDIMAASIERARLMAELPASAFKRLKHRLNTPSLTLNEELLREEDDQAVLLLGPEFNSGYAAALQKKATDFTQIKRETDDE